MSRFTRLDVYGRLLDEGLVPIFHHADPDIACRVVAAIAEVGATSIRDMGKVMAALKARYTGQMDFGKAGPLVKARLG